MSHPISRPAHARFLVGASLCLLACFSLPAAAQVRGTIFGPGVKQFPVAVAPLKNLGGGAGDADVANRFADIVMRDLELSGLFRVLPRDSYIEKSEDSGITAATINFGDWSVIGALALVKGGFHVEGDKLRVEARLFDVFQRRLLVGRNYHGKPGNVRRMAHRFADEILRTLTGERGPFDTRIAFVSTRAGRFKEVYVMSLDGQDARQLTFNQTINLSPAWGPAGSLLFTSYKRGNPDLYRMNLATGGETRLAFTRGLNLGAELSPDGRTIALSSEERGNPDIVLIGPDGGVQRWVTDSYAIDVSPAWSPDGSQLAFCSNRAGGPQIYITSVSGGGAQRVTFDGTYNTSPAWSPKGDRIAYVSRIDGKFHVYTVRPDGSDVRRISRGGGDNEDPSWSPDGRYLVYSSSRGGSKKLFVADANGTSEVQLTRGNGDDSSPAWSRWLD